MTYDLFDTYIDKTKDLSNSKETKGKGAILKNSRKTIIVDRCLQIQALDGPNLLNENDGYCYRLVNPVMSKEEYLERMFIKKSWEINFRLFTMLIQRFLTICNKKYGKEVNAEKEAWRAICLNNQHLYPTRRNKLWTICYI